MKVIFHTYFIPSQSIKLNDEWISMEIYGFSSHPGQTEGKSSADQYDYRYNQERLEFSLKLKKRIAYLI
jgi:hypothetical protein